MQLENIENIITWDYECIFTGLDINGHVPFQSEFIIILQLHPNQAPGTLSILKCYNFKLCN